MVLTEKSWDMLKSHFWLPLTLLQSLSAVTLYADVGHCSHQWMNVLNVKVHRRFCLIHLWERSLLQSENHIVFAFHSKAVQLQLRPGTTYVDIVSDDSNFNEFCT